MEISVGTIISAIMAILTVIGLIWNSSAKYAKSEAAIGILESRVKDQTVVIDKFEVKLAQVEGRFQSLKEDAIRATAVSSRLTEVLDGLSTKITHLEDKVGDCTNALMEHMAAEEKVRTGDTQRNSTFQFEVLAMLRELKTK